MGPVWVPLFFNGLLLNLWLMEELNTLEGRLNFGDRAQKICFDAYNLLHPDDKIIPVPLEYRKLGYVQSTGVDGITQFSIKVMDAKGHASFDFIQCQNKNGIWRISMPNPIYKECKTTHYLVTYPALQTKPIPYIEYTKEQYILRYFKNMGVYLEFVDFIYQWDKREMTKDEIKADKHIIEDYLKNIINSNFIIVEKDHDDSFRFGIKYNWK